MKTRFLLFVVLVSSLLGTIFTVLAQAEPHLIPTLPDGSQFPGVGLELVYQEGGRPTAVVIQDNYVYVGLSHRLVVLDQQNPTILTPVGQTELLPAPITNIALTDNYAYLVLGSHYNPATGRYEGGAVQVVDISNSADPVLVYYQDTPGPDPRQIVIEGNYAYITFAPYTGTGLYIMDISTPWAPVGIGSYEGDMECPAIVADYAYCALFNGPLIVLNLADRANPTLVTTLSFPVILADVKVVGSHAYVVGSEDPMYNGDPDYFIFTLDITNPATPTLVNTYERSGRFAAGIEFVADYAYVTPIDCACAPVASTTEIDILDFTNPLQPIAAGTYNPPSGVMADIAVHNNEMYFLSDSLSRIDVSTPTNPTEVASYIPVGLINQVLTAGEYMYAFISPIYPDSEGDFGFFIFDVSNRASPAQQGFYPIIGSFSYALIFNNYLVYTTPEEVNQIHILDISDPANPTELGVIQNFNNPVGIAGQGNYLYIIDYEDGLHILDISDPTTPTEVGYNTLPSFPYYLEVTVKIVDHYAYVFNTGSLVIIDVVNPAMPQEVGQADGWGQGPIEIVGQYGYAIKVMATDIILTVYDISNPLFPVPLDELFFPIISNSPGGNLEIKGNYLYLAEEGTAWVIDISDHTSLEIRGTYESFAVGEVAVVDNYLYMAGNGLYVLSHTPVVSASIPITGGSLTSTFDQTSYLFAASTFSETVTAEHYVYDADTINLVGLELVDIDHFFKNTAVLASTSTVSPTLPYSLTIQYTDEEKGAVIEDTLALYSWDGTAWVKELDSTLDATTNTITTTPDHFGLWAVLGETYHAFLPLVSHSNQEQ